MQDDQQKRKTIAKRIIIAVIIVVAVFAVGLGVALLLRNVSDLAKDRSNVPGGDTGSQQVSETPSAKSIIEGYVRPENMRVFSSGYQLQQDATAPSRLAYKAEDKSYEVSLSTENYAMFYAKDGAAHADAATVEAQTTSYLQDKGFQKVAAAGSTDMTTYVNGGSVCQLTKAPTSTPAYYLMACADKADVDTEYASVQKLLDLYKKSYQLDAFSRAISSTITAGNKSMTTLSLTVSGKHPVLLFAAVDGSWAYLGDLGGGNETSSNGKYSLTPQMRAAIQDPKYGDFLTKNIQ